MSSTKITSENITVEDLSNLVGELRVMAKGLLLSEFHTHTFSPTDLAMTALRRAKLKEQDWEDVRWENRAHFFSALATAMRHALIDHARKKKTEKRPDMVYLPPDEDFFADLPAETENHPGMIILLEEALEQLEMANAPLASMIYQYYYLGYSIEEMAKISDIGEKTVDRYLKKARVSLESLLRQIIAAS